MYGSILLSWISIVSVPLSQQCFRLQTGHNTRQSYLQQDTVKKNFYFNNNNNNNKKI